ncbi:MAG: DUF2069 domain-containing protein [Candidatus Dactylopiibacterium sp.]|nr:DUF2069 domain-containing protein [Candidatus Dactylopiibacterium sp.]
MPRTPRHILRLLRVCTCAALLALIALCLASELWLAPLRPGGSWLVLKVLPLLAALPGVLAPRRYTYQWLSLAIWLYVAWGAVNASSGTGAAVALGALEALLASALFVACALFARFSAPSRLRPDA